MTTTQWPKDTKGIIRSRKSNEKQHNDQKIPKDGGDGGSGVGMLGVWSVLDCFVDL
jgi:hypothetical protein